MLAFPKEFSKNHWHLHLFGRSCCRKRDAKSWKRSSESDQTMNSMSPPERALVNKP